MNKPWPEREERRRIIKALLFRAMRGDMTMAEAQEIERTSDVRAGFLTRFVEMECE